MNKQEKYKYWLMLSDYDLETIDVLVGGKRWVYVAYLCQQALERQLKGLYVFYTDKEAPKTHNLNFLFHKITSCDAYASSASPERTEKQQECEDFLIDAMYYFMSDYPFSYKNIMNRFVDEPTALELYRQTKSYLVWLRSLPSIPSEEAV